MMIVMRLVQKEEFREVVSEVERELGDCNGI